MYEICYNVRQEVGGFMLLPPCEGSGLEPTTRGKSNPTDIESEADAQTQTECDELRTRQQR
jgi:hypothetical protein